jgi:hypothetical protein
VQRRRANACSRSPELQREAVQGGGRLRDVVTRLSAEAIRTPTAFITSPNLIANAAAPIQGPLGKSWELKRGGTLAERHSAHLRMSGSLILLYDYLGAFSGSCALPIPIPTLTPRPAAEDPHQRAAEGAIDELLYVQLDDLLLDGYAVEPTIHTGPGIRRKEVLPALAASPRVVLPLHEPSPQRVDQEPALHLLVVLAVEVRPPVRHLIGSE